jgi:hypothetical protein
MEYNQGIFSPIYFRDRFLQKLVALRPLALCCPIVVRPKSSPRRIIDASSAQDAVVLPFTAFLNAQEAD